MAVERLKGCDNIIALAEELGVHRRLLYKWRDQLEPIDDGQVPPGTRGVLPETITSYRERDTKF